VNVNIEKPFETSPLEPDENGMYLHDIIGKELIEKKS
jgi:hypothetical protein